jgi:hypothetical protein
VIPANLEIEPVPIRKYNQDLKFNKKVHLSNQPQSKVINDTEMCFFFGEFDLAPIFDGEA